MSVHAGHRSRMRNRFQKTGLSNMETHEVLELLHITITKMMKKFSMEVLLGMII